LDVAERARFRRQDVLRNHDVPSSGAVAVKAAQRVDLLAKPPHSLGAGSGRRDDARSSAEVEAGRRVRQGARGLSADTARAAEGLRSPAKRRGGKKMIEDQMPAVRLHTLGDPASLRYERISTPQ